jgi:asparagine synthase (glutamine-hydrolysing)
MLHEPSYSWGTYANNEVGLAVGWVSHRGSISDGMPLWNERRDVGLVFSGEDFLGQAEAHRFGLRAHEFASGTASYVIALYEALGSKFIEKLNGCFSGLLIDLRTSTVTLFNDRYGLARLYYHEEHGNLYFASEAKSLLEALPALRQLDPRAIAETLTCGSVLQDRTFFAGVSLLPKGSSWRFGSREKTQKTTYFSPRAWEAQPVLSKAQFYERLKHVFASAVERHLVRAPSIAMSLTGGLDGRMILAWANLRPGMLPCYTFGGTYRASADVKIARRLADLCGQTHQTLSVGSKFLAEFPALVEETVRISDGTMDATGAVELYANRCARQVAPIRLTGNYGSELMRGNVAFRPQQFAGDVLEPSIARLLDSASATYWEERKANPITFIAFKQLAWHHYARRAIEQSQLVVRSPFLDNDLVALMYQAPIEIIDSPELSLQLIYDGNPAMAELPTDRGLAYKGTAVTQKMRQLSAGLSFKAEYLWDYGMPHQLAAVVGLLEKLRLERMFLGRHKFYHFRLWYRNELSGYLREVLLSPRARQRGYIQGHNLERMVNAHIEGRQNWTREIHQLLTLELLQRCLLDRR